MGSTSQAPMTTESRTVADQLIASRLTGSAMCLADICDADTASAIAEDVARRLGGIAGWKAAILPDGSLLCAPLGASSLLVSPPRCH